MTIRPDIETMNREKLLAYIDDLEAKIDMQAAARAQSDQMALQLALGMTGQEAKFLLALADGGLKSKEQLINALYWDRPNDVPVIKIVDVFACKVRKKLAGTGIVINTVWAGGYYLTGKEKLQDILSAEPGAEVDRGCAAPAPTHKPAGVASAPHGSIQARALDWLRQRAGGKATFELLGRELSAGAGCSASSMIRNLEKKGALEVLRSPGRGRSGPWKIKMARAA